MMSKTCKSIIKSGKNKGNKCTAPAWENGLCGKHQSESTSSLKSNNITPLNSDTHVGAKLQQSVGSEGTNRKSQSDAKSLLSLRDNNLLIPKESTEKQSLVEPKVPHISLNLIDKNYKPFKCKPSRNPYGVIVEGIKIFYDCGYAYSLYDWKDIYK